MPRNFIVNRIGIDERTGQPYTFNGAIDAMIAGNLGPYKLVPLIKVNPKLLSNRCPANASFEDMLDTSASEAHALCTIHPDYDYLAARLILLKLMSTRSIWFSEAMLNDDGEAETQLNTETLNAIRAHRSNLDDACAKYGLELYNQLTYGSVRIMEISYLRRTETPIFMYMRTAIGLFPDRLKTALELFDALATQVLTLSSPILFNSGCRGNNLSSCYVVQVDGSGTAAKIKGLRDCAVISEKHGGIGVNFDGDNCGEFASLLDHTLQMSPQGGVDRPRRSGAAAVYRDAHESDILDLITRRRPSGSQPRERLDSVFPAIMYPDIFIKRLDWFCKKKTDKDLTWSLFRGEEAKALRRVHGDEYERLYLKFEREGRAVKIMPVNEFMETVCKRLQETGTPFQMMKDVINAKSNHRHMGTIRGGNLCTEVLQYSSKEETPVCVLASLNLEAPYSRVDGVYDFGQLKKTTALAVLVLNRVLDITKFPTAQAQNSAYKMRAIGIGGRNMAGLFAAANLPFTSLAAQCLNRDLYSTIYRAALRASIDLAKENGPYPCFKGSDFEAGIFQTDYPPFESECITEWGEASCEVCRQVDPRKCCTPSVQYQNWGDPEKEWFDIKSRVKIYGIRNSMLTAQMPTVGTSQLTGSFEAASPPVFLINKKLIYGAEFQHVNRDLVRALEERGLWTKKVKDQIVKNGGHITDQMGLPPDIVSVYRTAFQISPMFQLKMARVRAQFIDQGQSTNIYLEDTSANTIGHATIYARKLGLKNIYYTMMKSGSSPRNLAVTAPVHTCSGGPFCKAHLPAEIEESPLRMIDGHSSKKEMPSDSSRMVEPGPSNAGNEEFAPSTSIVEDMVIDDSARELSIKKLSMSQRRELTKKWNETRRSEEEESSSSAPPPDSVEMNNAESSQPAEAVDLANDEEPLASLEDLKIYTKVIEKEMVKYNRREAEKEDGAAAAAAAASDDPITDHDIAWVARLLTKRLVKAIKVPEPVENLEKMIKHAKGRELICMDDEKMAQISLETNWELIQLKTDWERIRRLILEAAKREEQLKSISITREEEEVETAKELEDLDDIEKKLRETKRRLQRTGEMIMEKETRVAEAMVRDGFFGKIVSSAAEQKVSDTPNKLQGKRNKNELRAEGEQAAESRPNDLPAKRRKADDNPTAVVALTRDPTIDVKAKSQVAEEADDPTSLKTAKVLVVLSRDRAIDAKAEKQMAEEPVPDVVECVNGADDDDCYIQEGTFSDDEEKIEPPKPVRPSPIKTRRGLARKAKADEDAQKPGGGGIQDASAADCCSA